MNIIAWIAGLFLLTFNACVQEKKPQGSISQMTKFETAAKFPGDLGSSTIDVSNYTVNMQNKYKTFLAVCSACHTPARAINSPYTTTKDWKRYVHRMRVKAESRGYFLKSHDEKNIVDFLVYDSKIRKLNNLPHFQSQQKDLAIIFDDVDRERDRIILEETKKLPKKESVYTGTP